jgi:probable rRNA maturation factor
LTEDADKPTVDLLNKQDLPADLEDLGQLARRVLQVEGVADGELSVTLVTEEEIAELHQRYMDEPEATDVLSFPQDDGPMGNGQPRVLGDVVICPAVASRQNTDLNAEMRLLLVHGILHLLGYDHQEEEERREMWDRQEALTGVRP